MYRKDAEAWAREQERRYDQGLPMGVESDGAVVTVGDLLVRYMTEVTSFKRSGANEQIVIRALLRARFCKERFDRVDSSVFAEFRDKRLREVQSPTVRRQLSILRHAFDVARKEWGYLGLRNPLRDIKLPSGGQSRERRLRPGEFDLLQEQAKKSRAKYLWPLIQLAIETGMRRGELLSLRWDHIDLGSRSAKLFNTKNGYDRAVPLTLDAKTVILSLTPSSDRVFPVTPVAVRHAWDRLTARAGLGDLHFHDLRHEAISRFFEKGLSVPEVALISGHRTPSQLFRYTQMTTEHVITRLDGAR
jgi:integrase